MDIYIYMVSFGLLSSDRLKPCTKFGILIPHYGINSFQSYFCSGITDFPLK